MPTELPIGLTDAFAEDESKQKQWVGSASKMGDVGAPPPLPEVVELVRVILAPVLVPASGMDAGRRPPEGPWRRPSTPAHERTA